MKKVSLIVSLLLALTMMVSLTVPAIAEEATSTPLVVGYGNFNQKFSPFFSETVYDRDVQAMTQLGFMVTDRVGGIIYNGIEGETVSYNGEDHFYSGIADLSVVYDEDADITTYTAKLRDDIVFSDGVPLTADDLIFSYYVYLDTSYNGQTTLNSYEIIGLADYRTQTTSDVYAKYDALFGGIIEAGEDHEWSESDAWTQEMQDYVWDTLNANWVADAQAIVDYVYANYGSAAEDNIGIAAETVAESEGLKVALGMVMWGFGDVEEGVLTAPTGATWTLDSEELPTIEDYYVELYDAYGGDAFAYWEVENAGTGNILEAARGSFIGDYGPKDEGVGDEGIPNISGINKLDDYTVEVKLRGFEAPAVYQVFGIAISPMHYYGDPEQYDYENNMFGFPRGDVSIVESKTTEPMGAGPYKFVSYENMVAYFEANENYYKGEPKTKYLQFKETPDIEMAPGVQTGTIDIANVTGSKDNFNLISSYNSNGELTGDLVTTDLVDNRGYGYIGMNADTMNVGGEPFSEASKALRKGIATIVSVYRDVAYDTYYGEAASVINYPISSTSWAAPQPTDEDYKVAFSVDVDGNDIYTSDMEPEARYEAAKEAAIGYLKAAGYTWDEATGKFTEAPEGAALSYEIYVGGNGKGDHPSFAVITDSKNALESIGLDLRINDPANTAEMWDALNAGTQEMWCAAWNSTIDPDMYQVYHSSNVVGKGGTDSNHYHVALDELDELILAGRQSPDQAYRKAIYKQALDIIVDAAVEIPAYQRQNAVIFSTERVDIDTLTPAITTNWDWTNDMELIEMTANQAAQ